jgi:cysteine desulfurase / selenocysteine lyase
MSTSDLNRPPLAPEAPHPVPEARHMPDFPSAGPLDPVKLARMASEFFLAAPQIEAGPERALEAGFSGLTTAPGSPPAAVPREPPGIGMPTDPPLPGIPAGGVRTDSVVPLSMPAAAPPPASGAPPSPFSSETNTKAAQFSFLEDARPLFRDFALPASTLPPAGPIGDYISREASPTESAFDAKSLPQAAALAEPPTPTLPGAFGFVDSSAIPAFSFLEEARPIFTSPPSIPGPAPALPENELSWGSVGPPIRTADDLTAHSPALEPLGFIHETRSITPPDPARPRDPAGLETTGPTGLNLSSYSFDAEALKRDFPILRERVHGRPLVWLDNAATTQKPQSVIDRLKYFYEHENSNVHRAAHELAARATDAYESAREKVRRFLNASSSREIIFVRGATEGINLISQSWGRANVQKDDEIVITWLEHHANIVPWQMLCSEKGARLRVAPVDSTGQVLLDEYEKLLGPRTRLVAFPQVSNALGVITPVHEIIEAAHRHGAKVLLDGAQSVSHMRVDVQALDCDFFVFSGHKVFAPTGIGVVYGKSDVLEHMPPWQGGGNMIQDVTFEKTVYQLPPQRFEAGTGNIADAVGLGAAIDYLDRAGMANITRHEHALLVYATEELTRIPGLRIIGTAREKAGVISLVMDGFRTEEIGDYLNRNGIAVRSGHHCAQPIIRRFGLESTVRASLALYNTFEDIEALVRALWNLRLGRGSIA